MIVPIEAFGKKGALILGGSPAGLQAALDLAGYGVQVHLVEPSPFLTNKDGSYQMNTRLLEVARHPNINVWTNTWPSRVEGKAGAYQVEIRQHPRYIDLEKCTACGACITACPVTVPGTNHKAIFLDGQPGAMAIDKLGKPPCANTCPGGIHVQGYVALVAEGRFQEAIDLVRKAIPFPGICGRVCTHPCEVNCRRAEVDQPVAVRLLKRFVSDWELANGKPPRPTRPAKRLPRKVAVVGAGPGGMAVADRLARMGYGVTVFEKLPVIGGMMAVGIPEYRLPRQVIAREYQDILDMGVEIRLNTTIGPDGKYTLDNLFAKGYEAICLAVGAHRSMNLDIPGEQLNGVVHGTEVLKAINLSQRVQDARYRVQLEQLLRRGPKTRVAVLGGGNTAMDVSRALMRQGLKEVRILYRRTRHEMPAMPEEVEDAELEGVKIDFLVSPVRVLGNEKRGVTGLECIRMRLGEPDTSGRRRPVPIAGSEFVINLDLVVLAIGQAPDLSFLGSEHGIAIRRDERINVADISFMTSRLGVFAVGDAVTSDKMVVIEAIGMGKQAAAAIDAYLRGITPEDVAVDDREIPISLRELTEIQMKPIQRHIVPVIPLDERLSSFREIELGYTAEEAMAEAKRCLVCGPCSECQACVQVCKTGAVIHNQSVHFSNLEVGALFHTADPALINQLGLVEGNGCYILSPDDTLLASASVARAIRFMASNHSSAVRPSHKDQSDGVPRIGIFVCQCGGEIDGVVNTEEVCKHCAGLPDVVYTQTLAFSCSPEATGVFNSAIEAYDLNRVVLAACACCTEDMICDSCTYQRLRCKQNLGLFGDTLAGIARSVQYELVNIREQCAWVHAANPKQATNKAICLVEAASAKIRIRSKKQSAAHIVENTVLVLGKGAAASTCKQTLGKFGVHAQRLLGFPDKIQRSGKQYIVMKNGKVLQASALFLSPRDDRERTRLLEAFGSPALQPHPRATGSGLETHRPGVYFCEPDMEPQTSGAAAATRLAAWLMRATTHPSRTAIVDPVRCRACGTCVNVCELGAPDLTTDQHGRVSSWIDPVICAGCGTCAAHCPSGAITTSNVNDEQLEAMLGIMLAGES
jgi:NADPH-dependent glutamate synthase beta subunit-like oxidoreductase/NAD-dependent dihydropyrimidine dehydrogenase PreA subunit